MSDQLAIDGGSKAILDKLPNTSIAAGRTFGPEEESLVIEAIRSGCLSRNGGTMVKALEHEFAQALAMPFAVACSSGTASVHLTLAALDLEPGEEVIVPPITDIGSLLPILWQNAIPVFADVDPRTLLLDPAEVEKQITPRTRAVIAVHLAGLMCPMDELQRICNKHNIVLIEDCSQAYWSTYRGKLAGTISGLACFSLQQSKHMSSGEGGLMVTSNPAYAERSLLFSDKAWPRDSGSLGASRFLFLSQNYRMSELSGAVARAQLKKVQHTVERRRERAAQLNSMIRDMEEVSTPFVPSECNPSWWLYMLRVNAAAGVSAQVFGDALVAEGVPAWPCYIVDPLYRSPIFAQMKTYGTSGYPFTAYKHQSFERGLCSQAEAALAQTIAIHWNENYTSAHVEQIAAAIRKVAHHFALAGTRR